MKRLSPHVALAALLACGCVRSNDPPRDDPAASSTATPLTTSTATEPPMQSTSETPPPPTVKPPDGPVLTPDQVWEKLFALIESLHSEADLNKAHIEQVIGLPLSKRPESNVSEYIVGDTTAGWRYGFDLLTYYEKDIRITFKSWKPDTDQNGNSSICTYPLSSVRDEMRRRGFSEHRMTFEQDSQFAYDFTRDSLGLTANYYFNGVDLDYTNTCLDRISMSFIIPIEELRREHAE